METPTNASSLPELTPTAALKGLIPSDVDGGIPNLPIRPHPFLLDIINPCSLSPCPNNLKCVITYTGNYTCRCPAGFVLNAQTDTCDDYDESLDPEGTWCEGSVSSGLFPPGGFTCACYSSMELSKDGYSCIVPTCGNDILDENEFCDGHLALSDGCVNCECSAGLSFVNHIPLQKTCKINTPPTTGCGDNWRNPSVEECEYGGFACDPITCKCQAPYVASSDPFSIDCVTPSDASVLSKCGDGRVALLREECDPQVELHCTDDCKCEDFYIPTPFGTCKPLIHCGNGVLETNMGEECDAWWDPGCSTATCKCDIAEGYYARGALTCGYYDPEMIDEAEDLFTAAVQRDSYHKQVTMSSLCPTGAINRCTFECDSPKSVLFEVCLGCDPEMPGKLIDSCGICRYPEDPNWNECGSFCSQEGFVRDQCGVCRQPGDPGFDSCVGCDRVPYSGAEYDLCNQCVAPGDVDWNKCNDVGCDGRQFSGFELDQCGECRHPSDPAFNQCSDEPLGDDDLRPIFLCWDESPNAPLDVRYVAYYSYISNMTKARYFEPGAKENAFLEVPNRGQSGYFLPQFEGHDISKAFRFRWNGVNDVWVLGGNTVAVGTSDFSLKCPSTFTHTYATYLHSSRFFLTPLKPVANETELTPSFLETLDPAVLLALKRCNETGDCDDLPPGVSVPSQGDIPACPACVLPSKLTYEIRRRLAATAKISLNRVDVFASEGSLLPGHETVRKKIYIRIVIHNGNRNHTLAEGIVGGKQPANYETSTAAASHILFHYQHGKASLILAEYGLDVVHSEDHGKYLEGQLEREDDIPAVKSLAIAAYPWVALIAFAAIVCVLAIH